ncbi:hypothetical protein CBR_g26035 [Chara braunii]|uniref:Rieske domain-containing protein n=1 Tax=Chara braunii TaxID=69332 RepID=A0A388L747_CHABU|nr:hypothetical protein CBR_g26035 [Chara braunii]|eukprot:GBG78098.1 hypothetical protein CBR_g26035 [Chara braunii]
MAISQTALVCVSAGGATATCLEQRHYVSKFRSKADSSGICETWKPSALIATCAWPGDATWREARASRSALWGRWDLSGKLRSPPPLKRGAGLVPLLAQRPISERSGPGTVGRKRGNHDAGARGSAQATGEDRGQSRGMTSTMGAEGVDEETPILPSSADVASEAEELAAGEGVFNWLRAWYPVAMADSLDKRLPHARTILGRRLVLWWDGKIGKWQAFLDMCPHRLAPLSEGRIHESGGLQCCYHGWVFDGAGACTLIPQAPKDGGETAEKQGQRSNSELVKMPQSCAVAYPCKEHQRMIWVWLDADAKEEAEATPPPTVPAIDDDSYLVDLSVRDLPYSYEALTENLVDPSHVDFAHHNMIGGGSRDMKQDRSFQLKKVSASCVEACNSSDFNMQFLPPVLILSALIRTRFGGSASEADEVPGRPPVVLAWYCTPVAPGRSRLFWGIMIRLDQGAFLRKIPTWWVHVFWRLKVLDSDLIILHCQDRIREYRRLEEGKIWTSGYFMPTAADGVIIGFRQWLYRYAGGTPLWPKDIDQSLPMTSESDRESLMERRSSHVEHCTACRGALKNIEIAIKVFQSLSAILVGSVVAATAAQVALFARIGAGLVVFAGVCALISVGLQALRKKFLYQPFVPGLWEPAN